MQPACNTRCSLYGSVMMMWSVAEMLLDHFYCVLAMMIPSSKAKVNHSIDIQNTISQSVTQSVTREPHQGRCVISNVAFCCSGSKVGQSFSPKKNSTLNKNLAATLLLWQGRGERRDTHTARYGHYITVNHIAHVGKLVLTLLMNMKKIIELPGFDR